MKHVAFLLLLSAPLSAQVTLPLSDNLDLQSNTDYQIEAGNYTLDDVDQDGLLRVSGVQHVTIDGAGVSVSGTGFSGNLIRIDGSDDVTIRNFKGGQGFFYAVYVTNSTNITIENCQFSLNKVDSTGWISIWDDYNLALGGGALFYNVNGAVVRNDTMHFQNDGLALYHCKNVVAHDNDFSWNTSFGIRMNFTDSCLIYRNNCAYVNRPYTDPSDCAALLMLVSNNNRVEHNDLSYSGDGVFLGQYQYSNIPNNNYFAYNECSYSPHNAIEATFANGNVYKHNRCNYSHYGFWLGYSFNTLVDSNDVSGNQYAGLAIDRGFNNVITRNLIRDNPTGILAWEGDPISGYETQTSHDYRIRENVFSGNATAVSLDKTEKTKLRDNLFAFNRRGIFTAGTVSQDTLSGNSFRGTTGYHIEHTGTGNLFARNNLYVAEDSARIARKIYDKSDTTIVGNVFWQPFQTSGPIIYENNPHHDLAEPPAHWNAYPEACWGYGYHEATTVQWDSTLKKDGAASVHLHTGNGWYLMLGHHPGGDSTAQWNFSEQDTLKFWLRTIRQVPYGFQFAHIRLGNDHGGWYEYTPPVGLFNNANLSWKYYKFPLSGNAVWVRTAYGDVSLDDINYVEVNADTWEFGFDLWVDGLRFGYASSDTKTLEEDWNVVIFPNPAQDEATVRCTLPRSADLSLELFDWSGRKVRQTAPLRLDAGEQAISVDLGGLPEGSYWCRLSDGNQFVARMLLVL